MTTQSPPATTARPPTALKVAKAALDASRQEATLLSQALQDLALGIAPAATETTSDDEGTTLTAALYRPEGPMGGHVVLTWRFVGSRPNVQVFHLDTWRDMTGRLCASGIGLVWAIAAERLTMSRSAILEA